MDGKFSPLKKKLPCQGSAIVISAEAAEKKLACKKGLLLLRLIVVSPVSPLSFAFIIPPDGFNSIEKRRKKKDGEAKKSIGSSKVCTAQKKGSDIT